MSNKNQEPKTSLIFNLVMTQEEIYPEEECPPPEKDTCYVLEVLLKSAEPWEEQRADRKRVVH